MKDYFKKVIAEYREQIEKSESADEVRALGAKLAEAQEQLAKIEAEEARKAQGNPAAPAFSATATYTATTATRKDEEDPLSTMDYRKAFMAFVQRGEKSDLLKRAASENTSGDLGVLLPNTVVQEIIKGVEGVYGQLYSKVRKTNVPGGVQYPIGAFSATMVWDGTSGTDKEHGVSEKQKAGGVTGFVQFTYHIGEIRIAQSLLQTVVTVPAFEAEIVKVLVEAYVKAMDEGILEGDGVKQPEGILVEAAKGASGRIPTANIISFTAEDMADWKSWQKKLFAKVPLSMRKLRPEFVMTGDTWESNIMTLEDKEGRPVGAVVYNPVTGDETCKFKGREVTLVEEGGLKSFDTASAGDFFAMYWIPDKAYAINSNMQFSYKKYWDEDNNQWVTKALVICDGKVLDGTKIYLLKKA